MFKTHIDGTVHVPCNKKGIKLSGGHRKQVFTCTQAMDKLQAGA